MVYNGYNKTNYFKKFKTMCAFGNDIRTGTLDMYMTNNEQNHLEKSIKEFKNKTRPAYDSNLRNLKDNVVNSTMALLKGREMVFKAFESGLFLISKDNSK